MSDKTQPPAPGGNPGDDNPDKKTRQPRGEVNKAYLAEFTATEEIVRTAQKTDYAAPLAKSAITTGFLTALLTDVGMARATAAAAAQKTTGRKGATKTETQAKQVLVGLLKSVQSHARQKYDGDAQALADYFVGGQRIDANRDRLEQCAAGMRR